MAIAKGLHPARGAAFFWQKNLRISNICCTFAAKLGNLK
jgi:hypothetical protein